MREFHDPGNIIDAITRPVSNIFRGPEVQTVQPTASPDPGATQPRTVEADAAAERQAREEAARQARQAAAARTGRRASALTPSTPAASLASGRRSLLGSSTG